MKSRLVVGPPPIKYVKKYSKGGKLPKYQTGGTLANPLSVKDDPWEYAQENGVVYTRKKGTGKWVNLGNVNDMSKLSSANQIARTAILDKYGKQLGISEQKAANVLPEVTVKPTANTSAAQPTKQATPTKQVTPSKFTGNEEMIDIVARSLMTPEGQMKYRPAQGTANVTSSPIEYIIGGGAKLGPLLAKTLSQAVVNTLKYQEKRNFEKPYRDLQRSQKTRKENPYDEPLSQFLDKQVQGKVWYNKMQRAKAEKKAQGSLPKNPNKESSVFSQEGFKWPETKKIIDQVTKKNKLVYGGSLPKKQLGGMANVGSTEQAGLGLLTTGLSAIPGVGAILAPIVGALGGAMLQSAQKKNNFNRQYSNIQVAEKGGMIKRKDGSYSKRGLWDNIRANKGSGKKPTKEMLEQERKIKAKMEFGGMLTGKSDLSFYKGRKHANGGIMVSSKGTPSNKPVAEVEGGETRFKLGSNAYIFSDKLTL